jgi:hypothetical protein
MGRGRRVFVGMIPRKVIGSSCLRHPDQLSVGDHAWELRTQSRSPIVLDDGRLEGRLEGETMQVVHPVCCGIDVHQACLTACPRCVQPDGQVMQDVREFATTHSALLALTEWHVEQHCPVVAIASTGVYWQPVYHVLSGMLEVLVGNAQEMRRRPGRKTDKADARWIAELLAHGLIRPSFLPPPRSRPRVI